MSGALNSTIANTPWRVALVGNPNCGKTALFNLLTGARQKVANYAGVTVERKVGTTRLANGQSVSVIDLPGTYSLSPATPDEQVTLEVIEGRRRGEDAPDAIVAVVDATNLRMNLRLVLELKRFGRPMLVALNMADMARAQGLGIEVEKLAAALGCPVVETVAVRHDGHAQLLASMQREFATARPVPVAAGGFTPSTPAELQREVRRILAAVATTTEAGVTGSAAHDERFHHRLDAVVMHPVWGLAVLAAVLFLIFQAVFSWANVPMDLIKASMAGAGEWVTAHMADGPLRSLLVDGVIAGVGSVIVFLPQILILFFFILILEDSGYLPRAAFLLDNLMGKVGLSGRAFIPLLSSFACAIPGIMAARVIDQKRDRLTTILVAPLMTCSARIPVYTLIISAFIPDRVVGPGLNLQGLVMFGLYATGILSALAVSFVIRRVFWRGAVEPFLMELPTYKLPSVENVARNLLLRAQIFLSRAGRIILPLMVLVWILSTFPGAPADAVRPAIDYSFAGMIGHAIQPLFAPIGFNWQMVVALIPGFAAREVAVAALGTVYAVAEVEANVGALGARLAEQWSLATGLSFLAWYVFAPQCAATLGVVKRETNSWLWTGVMLAYMTALAYLASFIVYHTAVAMGGG